MKWKLENKTLDQLKDHPKNPRRLSKKVYAELKKSIEKEGIKEPVDVSIEMNDGNNISFTGQNGKHRYLAMKQLGYTIVPCKIM